MQTLIAVVGIVFLLTAAPIAWLLVRDRLRRGGRTPAFESGTSARQRNSGILWGLTLLAIAYGTLLSELGTLTRNARLDGTIGVILGLYICSHPAANAVNALFFDRHTVRQLSSEWSLVGWLALNLLTLLAGWAIIYLGLIRLVARVG